MLNGIFDTHAHYDDERYDGILESSLETVRENGVELILTCGSDLETSEKAVALSESYPYIYGSVGVHPHAAKEVYKTDYLDKLRKFSTNQKIVAIGEIGLDYYYEFSPKMEQKQVFIEQLELAKELSLPTVLHMRDATEDMLEILFKHKPKGVLHRYPGSVETSREIFKHTDLYIGIGCSVTYKNSKKETDTVKEMPLERLLLETDCPYLSPSHIRRELNLSHYISFAAERIAEIRGDFSAQEIIDIARENGKRLFGID